MLTLILICIDIDRHMRCVRGRYWVELSDEWLCHAEPGSILPTVDVQARVGKYVQHATVCMCVCVCREGMFVSVQVGVCFWGCVYGMHLCVCVCVTSPVPLSGVRCIIRDAFVLACLCTFIPPSFFPLVHSVHHN